MFEAYEGVAILFGADSARSATAWLMQSVGGNTCYFKHRKYQNLWINNKVRGD